MRYRDGRYLCPTCGGELTTHQAVQVAGMGRSDDDPPTLRTGSSRAADRISETRLEVEAIRADVDARLARMKEGK